MNNLDKCLQAYEKAQRDRQYNYHTYSPARIGIGHTGGHMKVQDWLAFQADYAAAKDALCNEFDFTEVQTLCEQLKISPITVKSQASDLKNFLLRPDLGRLLDTHSQSKIAKDIQQQASMVGRDLLIVISGGLSPTAIQHQLPQFLPTFIELANRDKLTFSSALISPRSRVAMSDHANSFYQARMVVMLIGERPGLSSPDSMSIYFTYGAKPGFSDEKRNCISNIHQHGLSSKLAAEKLIYLLKKSMQLGLSGVELKDDYQFQLLS